MQDILAESIPAVSRDRTNRGANIAPRFLGSLEVTDSDSPTGKHIVDDDIMKTCRCNSRKHSANFNCRWSCGRRYQIGRVGGNSALLGGAIPVIAILLRVLGHDIRVQFVRAAVAMDCTLGDEDGGGTIYFKQLIGRRLGLVGIFLEPFLSILSSYPENESTPLYAGDNTNGDVSGIWYERQGALM